MAAEKLEPLILQTLALNPLHGYGIGQRIEQTSGGVFRVTLGSLYPALQRLDRDASVHAGADWGNLGGTEAEPGGRHGHRSP